MWQIDAPYCKIWFYRRDSYDRCDHRDCGGDYEGDYGIDWLMRIFHLTDEIYVTDDEWVKIEPKYFDFISGLVSKALILKWNMTFLWTRNIVKCICYKQRFYTHLQFLLVLMWKTLNCGVLKCDKGGKWILSWMGFNFVKVIWIEANSDIIFNDLKTNLLIWEKKKKIFFIFQKLYHR